MPTSFSASDIQAFRPTMKIGLLGTVNDQGLPHLTLIASLQASGPTQVVWGQFTEGLSKQHVRRNPKTGFLIMTLDKALWRGRADFTHTAQQGPEYDMYNNTPMFRYNAYFGIHTVYYMDLLEQTGRQDLPMAQVVWSAIRTMLARALAREKGDKAVLNPWTRQFLNGLSNLKFLAYVRPDGYPHIIPTIQAQAAGSERVVLALSPYREELRAIPAGAAVALFAMSLDMETVLMRGVFQGIRRIGGVQCGTIAVNWVYNSMPPKPQQIYPEVEIERVTTF